MPSPQQQGKVSVEFLEKVVFSHLGARRSSVVVGPGQGLDNAVISLGGERVLLVKSDPLSVIPSVGLERSAWLSVHLVASDLSTSGVAPQFAVLDLNLPLEMDLDSVAAYAKAIGEECKRLGIAIVGGHTGRYPGLGYTIAGGGTMFSVARRGAYVTPAMSSCGDSVLITKGAAIGATAILASSFPATTRKRAGAVALEAALARIQDCTVVPDALAAASVGLHRMVTSMHDATEGGVLGGLSELSSACGLPVIVDREKIHVPDEARAVCEAFGLDPLTTTSEGTLVITCRPEGVEPLLAKLARRKIACYEIGFIGRQSQGQGLWVSEGGSKPQPCSPGPDKYWSVYADAMAQGLDGTH